MSHLDKILVDHVADIPVGRRHDVLLHYHDGKKRARRTFVNNFLS